MKPSLKLKLRDLSEDNWYEQHRFGTEGRVGLKSGEKETIGNIVPLTDLSVLSSRRKITWKLQKFLVYTLRKPLCIISAFGLGNDEPVYE